MIRSAIAPAAAVLAALLAGGCSLSITRTRVNVPLREAEFRTLEVGKTTKAEAFDALGAPDKVEAAPERDYLWWLHKDTTGVGLRISSPVSIFGYRHTFAEIDVDAEDTSAMRLTFDRRGILEDKSLRLAPVYREPEAKPAGWSFLFLPRFGYGPLAFGDAGEKGYGTIFPSGQLAGGYLGAAPTPFFMLLLGGNFQTWEGGSFNSGGDRYAVEDLNLYQVEAGGRFSVPPEFFVSFWSIDKLKEMFYTNDVDRRRGPLFYFQWTVGGAVNEEVGLEVNGVDRGSWFDRSLGLSTGLSLGVEYTWRHLGIWGGVDYQLIDAFDDGNAPVDDEGDDFQGLIVSGGLSWRF